MFSLSWKDGCRIGTRPFGLKPPWSQLRFRTFVENESVGPTWSYYLQPKLFAFLLAHGEAISLSQGPSKWKAGGGRRGWGGVGTIPVTPGYRKRVCCVCASITVSTLFVCNSYLCPAASVSHLEVF